MKTILLFVLLFVQLFAKSQQSTMSDLELILRKVDKTDSLNFGFESLTKDHSYSPAQLLLIFYQKVLSEQISAHCEFEMSCSSFSRNAIKEFGFVRGLLATADRLTRCNGVAQLETHGFLINHQIGKVIDVPALYFFNK